MKKLLLNLIFLILIVGCSNSDRKHNCKTSIDDGLAKIIDSYIEYRPIEMSYGKTTDAYYAKGFSHPSYHVYFKKVKEDTILTITIFPQLHTFELDARQTDDKNEDIIMATYPKGFFTYKKKYPIIIFDEKSIANKFYNKEVLHSIADTLITTNYDDIRDYKSDRWVYRIKDGKIANRIR